MQFLIIHTPPPLLLADDQECQKEEGLGLVLLKMQVSRWWMESSNFWVWWGKVIVFLSYSILWLYEAHQDKKSHHLGKLQMELERGRKMFHASIW